MRSCRAHRVKYPAAIDGTSDRIDDMPNARFKSAGVIARAAHRADLVAGGSYEVQLRYGKAGDVPTFLFVIAILCGLTAAISRLVRPYKHTWPLSALLAGVGALEHS